LESIIGLVFESVDGSRAQEAIQLFVQLSQSVLQITFQAACDSVLEAVLEEREHHLVQNIVLGLLSHNVDVDLVDIDGDSQKSGHWLGTGSRVDSPIDSDETSLSSHLHVGNSIVFNLGEGLSLVIKLEVLELGLDLVNLEGQAVSHGILAGILGVQVGIVSEGNINVLWQETSTESEIFQSHIVILVEEFDSSNVDVGQLFLEKRNEDIFDLDNRVFHDIEIGISLLIECKVNSKFLESLSKLLGGGIVLDIFQHGFELRRQLIEEVAPFVLLEDLSSGGGELLGLVLVIFIGEGIGVVPDHFQKVSEVVEPRSEVLIIPDASVDAQEGGFESCVFVFSYKVAQESFGIIDGFVERFGIGFTGYLVSFFLDFFLDFLGHGFQSGFELIDESKDVSEGLLVFWFVSDSIDEIGEHFFGSSLELFSESVLFFKLPSYPAPAACESLPEGSEIPVTIVVTNDGKSFSNPLDFTYIVGRVPTLRR